VQPCLQSEASDFAPPLSPQQMQELQSSQQAITAVSQQAGASETQPQLAAQPVMLQQLPLLQQHMSTQTECTGEQQTQPCVGQADLRTAVDVLLEALTRIYGKPMIDQDLHDDDLIVVHPRSGKCALWRGRILQTGYSTWHQMHPIESESSNNSDTVMVDVAEDSLDNRYL